MFNLSLLNGVFPDIMIIARVIPLFKGGNTKEFSNYRPISLLPQFSKILEKIYHSRLMAFIDSNQEMQKELHLVFIDLEMAYDRVPRQEVWRCLRAGCSRKVCALRERHLRGCTDTG